MDADILGDACLMLKNIDVDLSLISVNSEGLDANEEQFMEILTEARHANIVFFKIHSDPSYFKKYDRLKEVTDRTGISVFIDCSSPEVMKETRYLFNFPDKEYNIVRAFIELGGNENNKNLLIWACKNVTKIDIDVPSPSKPKAEGLYHPRMPKEIEEQKYLDDLNSSKPTVGIMFPQAYWIKGNLEPINELIKITEDMGANTIPVFFITSPSEITNSIGITGTIEKYLMNGSVPRVDSVIMAMGFSQVSLSDPGNGKYYEKIHNFFADLNVAVLQANGIHRSRDNWKEDTVGMGPAELVTGVVSPEFDGQIITVPLTFMERDETGNYKYRSVPDRVYRIASLAIEWAILRRTPINERKIAIMLNMYPPSNDRLGGAGGLDTFQSIKDVLIKMKKLGYTIDHLPNDGKEILDEMLAGLTNDLEWIPEDEIPKRAYDMTSLEKYMEWFNSIPTTPRKAMCHNWGEPPGEITTYCNKFIVPGIRNGNVFIGIQPNRGHHAHAEQLYHSTDVVMPHQYLAYYKWIKYDFHANVLIHMGTHGTLEWLPGKGNGLSENCYPDVILDTMPNVYPYIIDDPGEGIEAKRRTNSVIIEYMVAAMTRAENYDDLMDLDSCLQLYLNSETTHQDEKSKSTAEKIYDIVSKLSMFKELGLKDDATIEDVTEKAELIYDYISEMKDALIKDGLHILGHIPEGNRMQEMIYSLSRLRNGNIPSLRGSIAEAMGFDLDLLLNDPSAINERTGNLNGTIIDNIDSKMQDILTKMLDLGFDKNVCPEAVTTILGKTSEKINTVIEYILETLYPNVLRIEDEINYLLLGTDGRFVLPGPSGSPTRGNAHLLPTGRNFYSIDPDSIPNEVCWKIGKKMADDMIERHVKDEGSYPENVGIIVWATDTMKTGGDDIAYILSLMGLKPKWGSMGGKVVGLEVIPLSELGRPRIDVTLRISGMFRDSFPNLVYLIDDGVEMISKLEESDENNFIKKHLETDIKKYIADGLSKEDAELRSMIRIFGDPPGEHGAGVDVLIESSKWNTIDDLAETYTTWGAHAYGRKWKGEKVPEQFKTKMASLDVTVKNHNDREFDLLDIDDDYSILGGMNAAVRVYGNHKPYSVMGDSSDPDRLKTRTLEEETAYVMRSRVLNPKWLEGLKPHGFRGAMELSKLTEYVLGWDATSDNIEPWMYQSITDKFILDKETRDWIEDSNPYALKEMLEDLLESIDRELWDAPDDVKEKLKELYLDSEGKLEEIGSKK